jgi:hypothetical protein
VAPTQDQLRELLAGLKPTVQLVALVLGAMALGEEFQHGTAMRTFLAAPRRRRVLLAKLAVHGAAAGLIGMVAVLCALATVAVWLGIDGAALPLGATSLTALAAVPLFAALACLLALGVGAMLRSSLATIAVILGWVLVVEPMLTASLPDSRAWLAFAGAGEAIVGAGGTDLLSRPAATLVFCAYIAVAAMVGGRVLAGRDVA